MALHEVSREYLRSVSPLAKRIADDLVAVKESYQELWENLSDYEKDQALDDAIIDPAVTVKYASSSEGDSRPEQLSPFSWFTKSQLSLCTVQKTEKEKTPIKRAEVPNHLTSPPDQHSSSGSSPSKTKSKSHSTLELKQAITPKLLSKPKNPPPPPPPSALTTKDKTDPGAEDIPKTGFDFLDNW